MKKGDILYCIKDYKSVDRYILKRGNKYHIIRFAKRETIDGLLYYDIEIKIENGKLMSYTFPNVYLVTLKEARINRIRNILNE